jgi:hypothetical protein
MLLEQVLKLSSHVVIFIPQTGVQMWNTKAQ